jgi:hypothetical protein
VNGEKGNSNFDVRSRFSFNYVYTLPTWGGKWTRLTDGWELNGAVILQSGQPVTLNYPGGDFNGSGEGDNRPDVVGPIQYNSGNPAQYLSLASFAIPCTPSSIYTAFPLATVPTNEQICVPGTRHFGSLGRGALVGPTFEQWDFSIVKNTPITERLNVQFRCDLFNILNHPNFANPVLPSFFASAGGFDNNPVSATYGHSLGFLPLVATGDVGVGNPFIGGAAPRGIQFGIKFSF